MKKNIESPIFVILGVTSNLSRKKLLPALYDLSAKGKLDENSIILGVSRRKDLNDDDFRILAKEMIASSRIKIDKNKISPSAWCSKCVHYQALGKGQNIDYEGLVDRLDNLEFKKNMVGNRVFYLALPPPIFPEVIRSLGETGLNKSNGWTRLVIEKPFGEDLESAQRLNNLVHNYFNESQIYRIDHYLGKETVQNLLVFRFANAFFERLWNRDDIESVEIMVAEKEGVEGRKYYDKAGALRDMIESHLTQLLTLIAMEIPMAFEADAIRNEKVKVLNQISSPGRDDVILGQYTRGIIDSKEVPGYLEENVVDKGSKTETFVALRLRISNWRWDGVPFYLYTGKRMTENRTRIIINFQAAPISIFHPYESSCLIERNVLIITLQPNEGFDLKIQIKGIGEPLNITSQTLRFRYKYHFSKLPDAYENLLLDVIQGDQTLFVRADEVESAWRLYTPLIKSHPTLYPYESGTWGPEEVKKIKIWNESWG
jgi:glucose-6-phosphate 1-dehydrogenase